MATFVYTEAKRALLAGEIDFDTDDIRVTLVMSNTTADTDEDVDTIGSMTTVDELNGAAYPAGGKALGGETVGEVNTSDYGYFDASDVTFTGIGAGSRQVAGAIVYKFAAGLSSSLPIVYFSFATPFWTNGGDVTLNWHADGILKAT